MDATNEQNHDNVKITHRKFKITNKIASAPTALRNDTSEDNSTPHDDTTFEFTFEPHSLTAMEIEKKTKEYKK